MASRVRVITAILACFVLLLGTSSYAVSRNHDDRSIGAKETGKTTERASHQRAIRVACDNAGNLCDDIGGTGDGGFCPNGVQLCFEETTYYPYPGGEYVVVHYYCYCL